MSSSRRPTPHERLHGPQAEPPPAVLRAGVAYTRFIPREELQDFASWKPDAFGQPLAEPQHMPEPEPAPQEPEPSIEEWLAEVRASRQAGYQDGYRDGLVALESFKESFATQTSGQMAQVLQTLDKELGQLEQQLASSVARVATELARQVVRSELATRPTLVADVAREAVNAVLMSARHINVQVNPDDHALVARGCEEALLARGARLLAHPAIARGGCRVESDVGVIDAGLAMRWAQATQALGTGVAWQDDDVVDLADGGGDA